MDKDDEFDGFSELFDGHEKEEGNEIAEEIERPRNDRMKEEMFVVRNYAKTTDRSIPTYSQNQRAYEDSSDYDYSVLQPNPKNESTEIHESSFYEHGGMASLRRYGRAAELVERRSVDSSILSDLDLAAFSKETQHKLSVFRRFVETAIDNGYHVREMIRDFEGHFEEIHAYALASKIPENQVSKFLDNFRESCDWILFENTAYHLDYKEKEELDVKQLQKELLKNDKSNTQINYPKMEKLFKTTLKERMADYPGITRNFTVSLISFDKSLREKFRESLERYDTKKIIHNIFNDSSVECWMGFVEEKTSKNSLLQEPLSQFDVIREALQLKYDHETYVKFYQKLEKKFQNEPPPGKEYENKQSRRPPDDPWLNPF